MNFIKYVLFKFIYFLRYGYKLKIKGYSYIGNDVVFEGKNVVYENCKLKNVTIGYATYISNNATLFNSSVGKYCSIGPNFFIVQGTHPTSDWVSTHPAFFSPNKQAGFTFVNRLLFEEHKYVDDHRKLSVMIGNDVWTGANVSVLEGVSIGNGAIIAAGSVVTEDIPPYSVCAGVPARVKKYRFSHENIDELLDFEWWNLEEEKIEALSPYFGDIKEFLKQIKSGVNNDVN